MDSNVYKHQDVREIAEQGGYKANGELDACNLPKVTYFPRSVSAVGSQKNQARQETRKSA